MTLKSSIRHQNSVMNLAVKFRWRWLAVFVALSVVSIVLFFYVSTQLRGDRDRFEIGCAADFAAIEAGINMLDIDSNGRWLRQFDGTGKHSVSEIESKRPSAEWKLPSVDPLGSRYLFDVKDGVVSIYTSHPNPKLLGKIRRVSGQ